MAIAVSIISMIVSVLFSLTMVVFLFAGMANSSPEQLAFLKRLVLSVTIVTAVSLVAAIWLLVVARPWWSAGAGALPTVYVIGLLIYLFATSS